MHSYDYDKKDGVIIVDVHDHEELKVKVFKDEKGLFDYVANTQKSESVIIERIWRYTMGMGGNLQEFELVFNGRLVLLPKVIGSNL
jgi:hypothetical protein